MDIENFISWFCQNGGTLDSDSMGLVGIPGQGIGAVALRDIPGDHTLFTIPRSLTLSTRTSSLPGLVGDAAWKTLQLDEGWVGLILSMMWEESRGLESKWLGYLESLPRKFDTPMFWSSEELKELEGTSVVGKIGREDAERDYHEKLVPALRSRPDLFDPSHYTTVYSLENYHTMGSRILSRSFQVERWTRDREDIGATPSEGAQAEENRTNEDLMEIDGGDEATEHNSEEGGSDDEEDAEDPSDVAMVPMADMLNARYGFENAVLFHEATELKMVTTRPIKAGEQIYNTYGDLPNSDLLRRYGHVDLAARPNNSAFEGDNPGDVVELSADLAVDAVSAFFELGADDKELKERIDWWLEEGGDDVFVLEMEVDIPDSLLSFVKLLLCSKSEWEKTRRKGKPPKPKMDNQVVSLVLSVLGRRLELYSTSMEEDVKLLQSSPDVLSNNKRNAIVVRIGEKRILHGSINKLKGLQSNLSEESTEASKEGERREKRKRDSNEGSSKRRKK